jgi:ABC-type methionine transport system permease subunit
MRFMLVKSYKKQYCFYQTMVVIFVYTYIVCLMSVYVCMYLYCYTQKGFICNKDYYINVQQLHDFEYYKTLYCGSNKH